MADEDSGQERTEEATARRRDKAREEGQVVRSRELSTTLLLLVSGGVIIGFGGRVALGLERVMKQNFTLTWADMVDDHAMFMHLKDALLEMSAALTPVFIVLALAALAGPVALGGWMFSTNSIMPQMSRLDPIQGLGRMFSTRALVELAKSVIKVVVIGGIAILVMRLDRGDLLALSGESVETAMAHASSIIAWSFLWVSMATLLIAAVDVPYQIWEYSERLKMTKQEVKEEYKDSEGKPEVKNKIRQLQREMSRRRMMEAVPQADVIITNPTHFAVALKYDMHGAGAPLLVAKGSDLVAFKIREIATAHDVLVVSSPVLARAIYFTTEIGAEIPTQLYIAVAKVLAYVFQLKSYRYGSGRKPVLPDDIDVPEAFRFAER